MNIEYNESTIEYSDDDVLYNGFGEYTRGDEVSLPADDDDLANEYTEQDYEDVAESDDVRVGQTGTGFVIHQFKDYVPKVGCNLHWEGQTNYDPASSTVYLQIFNRETEEWETIDSEGSIYVGANTDFVLTGDIVDLTDYKDSNNVISCRVWQSLPLEQN